MFCLTRAQLRHWTEQPWFLDRIAVYFSFGECSNLGLVKTFTLYKPSWAYASFLELAAWGVSFAT